MTDVRRDLALGLGAVWLLSAAASGRARHAMLDLGRQYVSGGSSRTRLEPSGVLGMAVGRVARAKLVGVAGTVSPSAVIGRARRSAWPAPVRHAELRYSDVQMLGAHVLRLRAAISDCVLDGVGVLAQGQARILRTGPVEAEIIVSAESLERYLGQRMPALRNARVALAGGRVAVEWDNSVPVGRAVVVGSVRPSDVTGVELQDVRAWLNGAEMAPALVASATRAFGEALWPGIPSGWGSSFHVRDVDVMEGSLRLVLAGTSPGD